MGSRNTQIALVLVALLLMGSCSYLYYSTIRVAEKAMDEGIERTEEAMTRIEEIANEASEREREERIFGKNPMEGSDAAYREENSKSSEYEQ